MRKLIELDDIEARRRLGRNLIIAGTVVAAAGLYAQHRQIVNAAISAQQSAAFETMWSSFDEGVKYGLQLAKDGITDAKNSSGYAFSAFDRPA